MVELKCKIILYLDKIMYLIGGFVYITFTYTLYLYFISLYVEYIKLSICLFLYTQPNHTYQGLIIYF